MSLRAKFHTLEKNCGKDAINEVALTSLYSLAPVSITFGIIKAGLGMLVGAFCLKTDRMFINHPGFTFRSFVSFLFQF